jgi:hypothetical protein
MLQPALSSRKARCAAYWRLATQFDCAMPDLDAEWQAVLAALPEQGRLWIIKSLRKVLQGR